MIGMCCERSRCLISSASSKPSSSGIWTSSRMHAKSSSSSSFSAAVARGDRDEPVPERLEDRLEREQVLLAVVDEQDVRALRRLTSRTSRRGRRGTPGSPRAAGPRRPTVAAIAASGIVRRSDVAGSCTIATPPRSLIRARPAAPSSFAPVRTMPTARSPYVVGGRLEQDVDRRPRELDRRVGREREVAVLDEHVVVGRAEVDVVGLERRLVVRVADDRAACGAGAGCSSTGPRTRPTRCCATTIGWCTASSQAVEQPAQRVQPAPGRPDHDELVHLTRSLR